MSISINCYSKVPYPTPQNKKEIKANLAAPLLTQKVRVNLFEFPILSSKSLEIFRELGYPAPAGLDKCALNVSLYHKYKKAEKSDPSLLFKIFSIAAIVFISAPLAILVLSAFAVPISVAITAAAAGTAVMTYKVMTSWSHAVLEKTKAKYAAKADFMESYKFSIGTDVLKLALDKNLAKSQAAKAENFIGSEGKIQLIEKNPAPTSLWQKVVTFIKPTKHYDAQEIERACADLSKVNLFYTQFDPLWTGKLLPHSELTALFQRIGIPVPSKIVNFDLNERTTTVLELRKKLAVGEYEHTKFKALGLSMLATAAVIMTLSVLTLTTIAAPLSLLGFLVLGSLVTLMGFSTPREKKFLEEFQESLKKEKQEIKEFLDKNYALIKEKLTDEVLAHPTMAGENRLVRQALQHLETLKMQVEFGPKSVVE